MAAALQRPQRAALRHHKNLAAADEAPAISFFLAKRFASFVLTLLAASVVIFTVLDVLPGNAAEVMLGESATPESVAALTAKLGLDRPALVRYGDWMKGLATGDLGISIAYDTPITQLDRRAAARHPAAGAAGDGADDGARLRRSACSPRRATAGPATSASWRSARSASRSRTSGSRSC